MSVSSQTQKCAQADDEEKHGKEKEKRTRCNILPVGRGDQEDVHSVIDIRQMANGKWQMAYAPSRLKSQKRDGKKSANPPPFLDLSYETCFIFNGRIQPAYPFFLSFLLIPSRSFLPNLRQLRKELTTRP